MQKTLLFLFLLYTSLLVAQPANNDCSSAQSIGTLPTPTLCTATVNPGVGSAITIAGSNAGATPANPYIYQIGCAGGSQSVGANDVWYSFTASGYKATITINSTFANPNVALYSGSCSSLGGGVGGCAVGTGGTVTLVVNQLVIGQSYLLQVSGNGTQIGTFTMQINNDIDCAGCMNSSTLTVNPLPSNGYYAPGTLVNFCFHINQFTKTNTNWLHGVQLSFGAGWDTTTLVPSAVVGVGTSTGNWGYYHGGCTSVISPFLHFGPGFYFETVVGDITPGNNFGDQSPSTGLIPSNVWNFCWSIKTKTGCISGSDLSVDVNTTGDGESGNWTDLGCTVDQPTNFHSVGLGGTVAGPDVTLCGSQSAQLTATGGTVFNWSVLSGQLIVVGTNFSCNPCANPVASPSVTTTYVVQSDYSGTCTNTDTVTVFVVPDFSVSHTLSNNNFCPGTATSLAASAAPAGTYTYTWSPSLYLSNPSISNPTATITASGIKKYYCYVTSSTGCVKKDSVSITVMPKPVFTVTAVNDSVCVGQTASLSVNPVPVGTYTYAWAANPALSSTTISNPTVVTSTAGTATYSVTVTNSSGCSASGSIPIYFSAFPSLVVSATNPVLCLGAVTTLHATPSPVGTYTYNWSPVTSLNSSAISGPTYTANSVGAHTYTATVINNSGCSKTAQTTVTVNPAPILTVTSSDTVCVGDPANLNVTASPSASYTYLWSPAANLNSSIAANPQLTSTTALGTTTYNVVVTNSTGCAGYGTTSIFIHQCEIKIYSGVSPNNDGNNDTWIIDGIESFPDNEVTILNKWGQVVWEGKNYDNVTKVWKGKNQSGEDLPDATYFYVIKATGKTHKGRVELVR